MGEEAGIPGRITEELLARRGRPPYFRGRAPSWHANTIVGFALREPDEAVDTGHSPAGERRGIGCTVS